MKNHKPFLNQAKRDLRGANYATFADYPHITVSFGIGDNVDYLLPAPTIPEHIWRILSTAT